VTVHEEHKPLTWLIEGLRSGRYTQGRGKLAAKEHSEGDFCYCCLGVACELYQVHVGGLRITVTGSGVKSYDGDDTHLPEKVREWLGFECKGGAFVSPLPSPDGEDRKAKQQQTLLDALGQGGKAWFRPSGTYENLVDANDDGYFTFDEIADLLDAGKVKGTEAYAAC
jgi:hypothetical protein